MDQSLKNKTRLAFKWNGINQIFIAIIKTLIGIVLARLLLPEDFGIIAMITVFTGIADAFIDGGFQSAIIQKKNLSEIDKSTVFFFNMSIALFFTLSLFFLAPLLDILYDADVAKVARVFSFYFLFNAFGLVQLGLIHRELEFKRQTLAQLAAQVTAGVVSIPMAYYGLGVWALVAFTLTRAFLSSLFYWLQSDWRPVFEWDLNSIKDIWSYSGKLLGASLIAQGAMRFDQFLVGKYFSPALLGIYYKARDFNMLPTSMISATVSKSLFPVFSKLQSQREKFAALYSKTMIDVELIAVLLFGIIAFSAKEMIVLLLGVQWVGMVPYFQILCVFSVIYVQNSLLVNICNSIGRTDVIFKINLYSATLRILTLTLLVILVHNVNPMWFITIQIFFMFLALPIMEVFVSRKLQIQYSLTNKIFRFTIYFIIVVVSFWIFRLIPLQNNILFFLGRLFVFCFLFFLMVLFLFKGTVIHRLFKKVFHYG